MDSVELTAGKIVHLIDKSGNIILDKDSIPILYQITAVYRDFRKVGLVTYYGEYVGTHSIDSVVYVAEGPIFRKEEYEVGSNVIWIDHEDVYEGTIESLGDSTAKMINIRKLMPIDYTASVPYWKIPDGRKITSKINHNMNDKLGGDKMSTKANIIIRNSVKMNREIYLYQHSDAHPNNLTLVLAERLRDLYLEFKDFGDVDWFLDPSKLASFLVIKSVPVLTEEVKSLMKQLPDSTRYHLESMYFLGIPSMLIENSRVSNCNYEYVITLSEDVEDDFFGYELDVNKMSGNKVVATVMNHKENLLREKAKRN